MFNSKDRFMYSNNGKELFLRVLANIIRSICGILKILRLHHVLTLSDLSIVLDLRINSHHYGFETLKYIYILTLDYKGSLT